MTPIIVRTQTQTKLWMDMRESHLPYGKDSGCAVWNRRLSDEECDSLLENPYQLFKKF